jgi:hypothetical protein
MRTFPVPMPSGMRYWTVIGEDLLVISVADAYLRYYGSGVMLPSRRQRPMRARSHCIYRGARRPGKTGGPLPAYRLPAASTFRGAQ